MQTGIVRNQFDKNGVLYVGQTGRGWRSVGSEIFGLQTVRWDRRTTPVEMHSIRLTTTGFEIRFTQPMGCVNRISNPVVVKRIECISTGVVLLSQRTVCKPNISLPTDRHPRPV